MRSCSCDMIITGSGKLNRCSWSSCRSTTLTQDLEISDGGTLNIEIPRALAVGQDDCVFCQLVIMVTNSRRTRLE